MFVYGKYECFVMHCICCLFVSFVHPVAVFNDALCMTCSWLMMVKDSRGDHMVETYSRAGLMTALYVTISVSFSLLLRSVLFYL